ncbi:MAG: sialate O-acetylesterase [Planctomycetia bacterium]|nr:sialate O-acetylesterase [Planctomycetia bacterium]
MTSRRYCFATHYHYLLTLLLVASWICATTMCECAYANVKLPSVFGDDMVLQRNVKTPIWGWAQPGEKILVEIASQSKTTIADENGQWRVNLSPTPAGGPYKLSIYGANHIAFNNVYFGEVWLCAGQANMSFTLKRSTNGNKEAESATYPQLRVFTVPTQSADAPMNDCPAKWQKTSPQTAGNFSAIAYHFGRYLHEELQVAVGVIVLAWTGSTAEAWVDPIELAKFPELAPLVDPERIEKSPPSQKAGALQYGMLDPICPYAIKGVIWYQGEANANRAWQYRTLFPLLIANWREKWGLGDFPFYFVQLPNFHKAKDQPGSSAWAELREAQHRAIAERNVAEVVAIDLGDPNNMTPKNKKTVSERLAKLALNKTYDKGEPAAGPDFHSMKIIGNRAILTFTNAEGLACAENASCDGSELKGFAIAGADKKFYWAEAVIENDTVVVSAPEVEKPIAVRYAWADNPACNLTNKTGLPTSPFRTDDWAGVTVNVK